MKLRNVAIIAHFDHRKLRRSIEPPATVNVEPPTVMIEDYLLRHNPFTFVLRQAKCSQIAASCTSWGEKGGGGPSGFLAPFNGTKGLIR